MRRGCDAVELDATRTHVKRLLADRAPVTRLGRPGLKHALANFWVRELAGSGQRDATDAGVRRRLGCACSARTAAKNSAPRAPVPK